MRTAVFVSMCVSIGLALLIKARDLREKPDNLFLRALCIAMVLVWISSFAGIPAILTFMETTSGVPAVWILVPLLATCASLQATMSLWAKAPGQARRRIRKMTAFYGIAAIAVIALTYLSSGHTSATAIVANQQEPEALWGVTPYLRDGFLVYLAAMIFTFVSLVHQFLRNAMVVDRRWLKRAQLTLAVGCAGTLTYSMTMASFIAALRFGVDIQVLVDVSVPASAVGGAICGAGIIMPVLGPRWDRMRTYRRLEPLWLAIHRAIPDVVLEPPWSTRLDSWNPQNLDFRLYRRVIEIHDGTLALRPYFDPGVPDAVRKLVPAQLSAHQVDTTIEAAQLALAIRARLAGDDPRGRAWKPPPAEIGVDFDAELRSLVPLAQTFASSTIVEAIAANRRHLNSPERIAALRTKIEIPG